MQPATKLEKRVVAAAEQALTRRRYVSPIDVLTGLGWLSHRHVEAGGGRKVLERNPRAGVGSGRSSSLQG